MSGLNENLRAFRWIQRGQIPRVKVCGIRTIHEAALAVYYGANALGLISKMPSGPGEIPEELIAEIASEIPPGIASFLLTSKQDSLEIIDQQRRCRCNSIQLCTTLLSGSYEKLREALPGIKLIQVIHVAESEQHIVDQAQYLDGKVDALLLDSGKPNLPVPILGGTGKVHDWRVSRRIVDSVSIPVFLAGGINASNVSTALETVKPYGVDLYSSLRVDGELNEEKVRQFFRVMMDNRSHSLSQGFGQI